MLIIETIKELKLEAAETAADRWTLEFARYENLERLVESK